MAPQRSRSDRAFERLYRRHVDEVYRYALAVLANRADAEDVTQTAFLNAYRAFQTGQHPDRPLNWLIAITHNVCRQRFRDAARRPREVVLDRELAAESGPDDGGGFRRGEIGAALSQLAFSQRAALAMRELEGRSYKEIAEVFGVTEAAVETLIFRARRAFREQLEGSMSCSEAELAISGQLDGRLGRGEKGELRAHLRACAECATLARRFRGQRAALKRLVLVPLQSLSSLSGAGGSGLAGGAALGSGLGVKAVAFGASALLAAGVGTEIATRTHTGSARLAIATRSHAGSARLAIATRSHAGSARLAVHAPPASELLASSRRSAKQVPPRPAARPTAAKTVSAPTHRGAHRAGPRGTPGGPGGKSRHRPAKTVWPAKSDAPATRPPTVVPDPAGRRRAHPAAASRGRDDPHGGRDAHRGRARKGHPADRPDRPGKRADASKPAGTPGSKAQRPPKNDTAGSSSAAAGSAPQAPGPPPWSSAGGDGSQPTPSAPPASSPPAAAGGPSVDVPAGPPADPAAPASSNSKDAVPRKR